jgi:hypothetical protein
MPADLDQFRRDNSHGAVIGGKGLVQLGHDPADGWGFFKEVDIVSGIGQIKGGLHTRDAGANDQDRPFYRFTHGISPSRLMCSVFGKNFSLVCHFYIPGLEFVNQNIQVHSKTASAGIWGNWAGI